MCKTAVSHKHLDDTEVAIRLAARLIMVNVKKRKGRVVIDSDSEDSASDDNLDQVGAAFPFIAVVKLIIVESVNV